MEDQFTWQAMGPYEWGVTTNGYSPGNGRLNCITVDPNDEDHIFVGAAAGGLWESSDGGQSWSTSTDQLAVLGITDIYIDPDDSNNIIILTGDAYGNDTPSVGLYKSTDGGLSWGQMSLQFDKSHYQTFFKLEVSPVNGDHMLVGGNGIYISKDGGSSWELTLEQNVTDVVMHPTDDQIVYAVGREEESNNNLTTYKSTDGGLTWSKKVFSIALGYRLGRKAIGVSPNSPDSVYILATSTSSTFGGLFLSGDQLNTLQLQSNSPNIFGYEKNGEDNSGQGWYDLSIAVSPDNPNEIYVSGIHIWKSTDAGINWELQNYWVYNDPEYPYVHADNHTLDFANGKLYAGGDGGIFMSADQGETFENLSFGLNIGQFYRIGTHPTDAGIVVGGLQDNGSFYRFNDQWKQIFGADGMDGLIDHTDPSYVYSEYQNGGIIRFRENAEIIDHYVENPEERGGWITPFIMHPDDHKVLYFGYQNIWKSTDQGTSMERISDFQTAETIRFLKQHQEFPSQLLTSVSGKLFLTTNEGSDWQDITEGLPSYYMTDAEFSYNDPETIYATFSNQEEDFKVYVSYDLGTSWQNVSSGIPSIPVNCIESQNSCSNSLFIGTDIGVYYKDDTMEQWEPYGSGLPNVIIDEVEVQYATGKVFVATYGRGVWSTDVALPIPGTLSQTLTFDQIEGKSFGDEPFHLVATSSEGLKATYKSSDPEILSISGDKATINKTGTVTITATQKGNCEFLEASIAQEITIDKGEQEITFAPLESKKSNDGLISLEASTSSKLPIVFTSSDEGIFAIDGSRGEIIGIGTVTITASQEGDDYYYPAEDVSQTLMIIALGEGENESLTVYPNPAGASTTLYFSNKEKREVELFNLNGQLIRSFSLSRRTSHELDLEGLKPGVYILKVEEASLEIIKE